MEQVKRDHYEKEISVEEYLASGCVDVPKFAEFCKACPNYENNWGCGPYDFDPMDIWRSYKTLRVILYRFYPEKDMTMEGAFEMLQKVKRELMEYTQKLEAEIPGSTSLWAGTCDLCKTCARKSGEPCRNPKTLRYSIEALGGDVGKTIKDLFDIEIKWGTGTMLPEYYVLCGGLLMK